MIRIALLITLGAGLAVMAPAPATDRAPDRSTDRAPDRPARGDEPGRGERSGPDRWRPSPEQMDRALELAALIDPPRGERIARMRADNPEQFRRWFMQSGRRLSGLLELKKSQPDFFKARVEELKAEALAHRLAAQWAKATHEGNQGEVQRLERELREAVSKQVDAGIVARGYEVVMLEERLKAQRKQLGEDGKNQAQLVEQRFDAIKASAAARGDGEGDDADMPRFPEGRPRRERGEPSGVLGSPPPGGEEPREPDDHGAPGPARSGAE